jgi:2-phosphoglycerate kinase
MLYLIGGSPRCGKTTFSKMLAYEKRISWFSTDLAATIIRPYLSEEDGNAFFDVGNILTDSPQKLLECEVKNAEILWPGVKRLIVSLLKWKHEGVTEGVHLLPKLLHELEVDPEWETVRDHVRIIYLVKKDEAEIIDGLKRSDKAKDWLLQSLKSDADLPKAAKMIREKSLFLESEARKYDYRVVNTENNFHETLKKLLEEL